MAGDVRLIRSPTSVLGMVLTTISAIVFLVVFFADLFGLHTNPYIGIVFFLVLPAVFLVGLILIPFGAWIERRRRAAGKPPSAVSWPRLDLNDPTQRATAVIIFGLTMANIVIVSLAAYRGVEYMDSPQFCGQVCHTAMKPEFVAHEGKPHARVKCVECHVGPGASSFAKAKLAGTRRLAGGGLRHLPAPNRRVGRAAAAGPRHVRTLSLCRSSSTATKSAAIVEYGDDEKNTASVTTLQVHVGGGDGRHGTATGIHWHMNVANEIEYIATDKERQVIPYVRMKDRNGVVREYVADGVTPDQFSQAARHRMDCTDCHNRPSHAIDATAERAVNDAMARGDLPTTLPFVHREAVKALKASYPIAGGGGCGNFRRTAGFLPDAAAGPRLTRCRYRSRGTGRPGRLPPQRVS